MKTSQPACEHDFRMNRSNRKNPGRRKIVRIFISNQVPDEDAMGGDEDGRGEGESTALE